MMNKVVYIMRPSDWKLFVTEPFV